MSVSCNPSDLLKDSSCLSCLTDRQLEWVKDWLLCQIANNESSSEIKNLFKFTQDVSTSSGLEEDFYTATIAVDTLDSDGKFLMAHWYGEVSDNLQELRIYWNGTRLIAAQIGNNAGLLDGENHIGWEAKVCLMRVSSSSAKSLSTVYDPFNLVTPQSYNLVGVNWGSTNILKITGKAVIPGTITAKFGYIDLHE